MLQIKNCSRKSVIAKSSTKTYIFIMVRRCVVPSCASTDQTTLVHRFPRKHCKTWQKCLHLTAYPINDLLEKYVVCAHHFRITDYRHKESKHLNTTAMPTLDAIPDDEKILEVQTGHLKGNKRYALQSTTNAASDAIIQNLNSNLVAGKTQIYSNCFTLSSSTPIEVSNSHGLSESDNEDKEINYNSDYDLIEDENYLDEDMLMEPKFPKDSSHTKESNDGNTITEYLRDDTFEETFEENIHFIGEKESSGDDNSETVLDDRLSNYVELIETNEDSDDEYLTEKYHRSEMPPQWAEKYKHLSRNDLIDQLVVANNRIKELENKFANIQKAHLTMIQNLNNFNKVLIS